MRVVSLACSNTEIVCALGCQALLVGVDDHSDHPAEALHGLPRVGPDLGIDVAKVASLRPDLVLGTLTVPGHEAVVEALERAGLPFVASAPESLEDVYRDVKDVARLLGVSARGEALAASMRQEIGEARPSEDALSILVQWWPKPVIAPGRRSWTTDLIEAAGARNPIGAEPVMSRPLSDAEVLELAPDAIVLSWCGVHPSKYRPDRIYENVVWAPLQALRDGHVYCIPEAWLGRPGPRLVEGVAALREVVAQVSSRQTTPR